MRLSSTLSTLLLAALAAAACDPLTSTSCDPDTALAGSFKETFLSQSKYFTEVNSDGLSYSSDGVKFELAKRFDNPSIKSNFYIMFGKVEVVMQAAAGTGIVSSFYLQSDDLDEIDIEMVGGDTTQFQSNFFSKGDTTTYTRGEYHTASSSVVDNYHTYTIEMTEDSVTWALDGTVVRTLLPDNGQGFPQSPMYIMAGVWAGGDSSNAAGTIEWAGGSVDYSQAPFDMYIKSLIVVDYSTGSEYEYSDTSGDWTSIKAVDGEVNGRKTQAESDFESLLNGEAISSSAATSATSASSTSSKSSSSSSSASSTSSSTATSSSVAALSVTSKSSSSSQTTGTASSSGSFTFFDASSTASASASSTATDADVHPQIAQSSGTETGSVTSKTSAVTTGSATATVLADSTLTASGFTTSTTGLASSTTNSVQLANSGTRYGASFIVLSLAFLTSYF